MENEEKVLDDIRNKLGLAKIKVVSPAELDELVDAQLKLATNPKVFEAINQAAPKHQEICRANEGYETLVAEAVGGYQDHEEQRAPQIREVDNLIAEKTTALNRKNTELGTVRGQYRQALTDARWLTEIGDGESPADVQRLAYTRCEVLDYLPLTQEQEQAKRKALLEENQKVKPNRVHPLLSVVSGLFLGGGIALAFHVVSYGEIQAHDAVAILKILLLMLVVGPLIIWVCGEVMEEGTRIVFDKDSDPAMKHLSLATGAIIWAGEISIGSWGLLTYYGQENDLHRLLHEAVSEMHWPVAVVMCGIGGSIYFYRKILHAYKAIKITTSESTNTVQRTSVEQLIDNYYNKVNPPTGIAYIKAAELDLLKADIKALTDERDKYRAARERLTRYEIPAELRQKIDAAKAEIMAKLDELSVLLGNKQSDSEPAAEKREGTTGGIAASWFGKVISLAAARLRRKKDS